MTQEQEVEILRSAEYITNPDSCISCFYLIAKDFISNRGICNKISPNDYTLDCFKTDLSDAIMVHFDGKCKYFDRKYPIDYVGVEENDEDT